nr:isocitrate lyase/phosphoenolpyruvate mutase family protein [Vibrio sp.]
MFKSLHQANNPLVICNVWDVPSAKLAEKSGFLALGTSSAAIASTLGKEDGENLHFEDVLFIVKAIVGSTPLPLTVDIESGYGDTPDVIAHNIIELVNIGVVGINIEDSVVSQGKRALRDSAWFANLLIGVKKQLRDADVEVFINVRTDAFLLNARGLLQPPSHCVSPLGRPCCWSSAKALPMESVLSCQPYLVSCPAISSR